MIESPMNSYCFLTWWSKTLWIPMVFEVAAFFVLRKTYGNIGSGRSHAARPPPGGWRSRRERGPGAWAGRSAGRRPRTQPAAAGAAGIKGRRPGQGSFLGLTWDFMEAFFGIGKTHFLCFSRIFSFFVFYFLLLVHLFEQKMRILLFSFFEILQIALILIFGRSMALSWSPSS